MSHPSEIYCSPETLTDETIAAMAQCEKVCHYIDMPIQHASDTVLKRMGRRSSQALIREKIVQWLSHPSEIFK